MSNFVIGLDLGQTQDYTAIALVEVVSPKRKAVHPESVMPPPPPPPGYLPP